MPQSNGSHRFGGIWTELKLDAVSYYCMFFNKVLLNQPHPDNPFKRWYFDGFAGSGTRQEDVQVGGLFDGRALDVETRELEGSALRALRVDPPFDYLAFIEGHAGRFSALEEIKAKHPHRNIECIKGDANSKLATIFSSPPWSLQRAGKVSHRGLCFLDPYGMNVDWRTLEILASTRAVDVWYLFPLDAVVRQLAGDLDRVDANKQKRLDEIFGTQNWRSDIYRARQTADLFAEVVETSSRSFDRGQIENYAQERLRTIFCEVSEPLPLLNERGRQIFSLFCLSNSASPQALALIKKGVTSVLKKYGPGASRHRSGH